MDSVQHQLTLDNVEPTIAFCQSFGIHDLENIARSFKLTGCKPSITFMSENTDNMVNVDGTGTLTCVGFEFIRSFMPYVVLRARKYLGICVYDTYYH